MARRLLWDIDDAVDGDEDCEDRCEDGDDSGGGGRVDSSDSVNCGVGDGGDQDNAMQDKVDVEMFDSPGGSLDQ